MSNPKSLLDLKNAANLDAWKRRKIALEPSTITVRYEPMDYRGYDSPATTRRIAGLMRLKRELTELRDELETVEMCGRMAE